MPITDVPKDKRITGILLDVNEISRVSRIGHRIEIYYRAVRVLCYHVPDKVTPDKSQTPGNKDLQKTHLKKMLSMF